MSREEQLTIALQWAQERISQANNK